MMNNDNRQLGIYIHIPFCVSKCIYCDFLSFPADDSTKEKYVKALCREIKAAGEKEYKLHPGSEVSTVFFGGGTPSILHSALIVEIMNAVKDNFKLREDAEVTIECNPGTVSKEKLETYRFAGINRISFGLQSPNNRELKMLGRIHTYEQFEESYIAARLAGFDNINIDLMSAIPGQNVNSYLENLRKVVALKPEHISAYSLIVEEGTPMYDLVERTKGRILPSEEEDRQMYALTKDVLKEAGYERYEISNYAKPGYECRHNISYWIRKDYLGFGLAAASLYDNMRFTNTREMDSYLDNPIENYSDCSKLSLSDAMEEYMFLGLRMMKGVSKSEFMDNFGLYFDDVYGEVLDRHIKNGLMKVTEDGDKLSLTDIGIDVSNSVMSDYILD